MVRYQILYWRDIPAQVKVYEEGKRPLCRPMPDRFQAHIDRLAMETGLQGSDQYLAQWRWSAKQDREGTAEEVAEALLRELEQQAGL